MPVYTLKNKDTDETWTTTMSISERDTFLNNNPHITQLIVSAPLIGDAIRLGVGTNSKPSQDFRDQLKEIKSKHRHSNINTW